jgi:hypothetical protein
MPTNSLEVSQFNGLRYRNFPLIFCHRPIVNLIFIGWAQNLLIKKIGRFVGTCQG